MAWTIPDQVYQQLNGATLSLPAADGGNGALSYRLNPDAPNGMNVTNRVLSGAPTNLDRTGTTYQWVASDEDGDTAELAFTITVVEPLTFRFSTPPEASDLIYLVNETISLTLPEAQGGHDPLVYNAARISAGDFAGLVYDQGQRVVQGSRATAGSVPLGYGVTDARGVSVNYSPPLSLTIEANTMPIFSQGQDIPDMVYIVNEEITPVTLPAVDPGTGNAPITHFIPTSTSPGLPPGLTFNAMTRVLSGTPDTEGTTNGIIYRAFDRNNDFTDKTTGNNEITFSIIVEADTMPDFSGVTTANLTFTVGKAITDVVLPEANGGNGDLTYTLPLTGADGLNFDGATRTLSGTPTFTTTFTAAYTATDQDGDPVTASFTIATQPDESPTFGAIEAQSYLVNQTITPLALGATGGNRGLTYTIGATPALHDGLTFNADIPPTLTGTPTAIADARTYTITATDADGSSASVSFSILITEPSATIISPASLEVDEASLKRCADNHQTQPHRFRSVPPPHSFHLRRHGGGRRDYHGGCDPQLLPAGRGHPAPVVPHGRRLYHQRLHPHHNGAGRGAYRRQ